MRVVLTHVGSAVPEYTHHCIKQLQYTTPGLPITFITHADQFHLFSEYKNIDFVNVDDLGNNHLLQEFRRLSWFKAWGKPQTTYPSPENFVQGTSERLFLLNAFMQESQVKNVWHIENDNLVYHDLINITEIIKCYKLDDKLMCCDLGPQYAVFNMAFIKKAELLTHFCEWYLKLLEQGNEAACQKYNLPMVQEMTVLKAYSRETDLIQFFPSIPWKDAGYCGSFFDPASYGQYLAGTNNGHGPGFVDTENHDIGKAISNGYFKHVSFSPGLMPMLEVNKDIVARWSSLVNLHMHNKTRIPEFITYNE